MAEYQAASTPFLQLGKGFDPTDPGDDKASPFESLQSVDQYQGDTLVSFYGSIDLVQSAEQSFSQDTFTASAEARCAFGGVSASLGLSSLMSSRVGDITFCMILRADYGLRSLSSQDLKPSADKLRLSGKESDKREFIRKYGREGVTTESLGAELVVSFSVHTADGFAQQQLSDSIKAAGGAGPYSGSISASHESIIQQAISVGTVEMRVFAHGGSGMTSGISDFLDAAGDFEKWKSRIELWASSLTKQNSVATAFKSNRFFEPLSVSDAQLAFTLDRYLDLQTTRDRCKAIWDGRQGVYSWVPAIAVANYPQVKERCEQKILLVARIGGDLVADKKPSDELPAAEVVDWPQIFIALGPQINDGYSVKLDGVIPEMVEVKVRGHYSPAGQWVDIPPSVSPKETVWNVYAGDPRDSATRSDPSWVSVWNASLGQILAKRQMEAPK